MWKAMQPWVMTKGDIKHCGTLISFVIVYKSVNVQLQKEDLNVLL